VLAAMSGGVDSAVAAALLAEQGHEVRGVTLKLWCYGTSPLSPRACCTLEAIDDARQVARTMDFPHHVVEAEEVFRDRVLQPFLDAYATGKTPYPCALCNQHLKFGDLVSRMELVGANRLATGHYARVEPDGAGGWALHRAVDRSKDQSYALALIPYSVLARVVFPLGGLHKDEVRGHAERLGLKVWDKPESQDLCFVPDGDYAGFMTSKLGETRGTAEGPVETRDGQRLGTHRGLIHYTVGQRKGLGIAAPEPLYVLELDPARNAVVVGHRNQLDSPGLETGPMNWLMSAPPEAGTQVEVQIRAHHVPAAATLTPRADGAAELRFDRPQAAVTPGQLAVIYQGDRVLGGGPIARALGDPAVADANLALAGGRRAP
jgi:tRNA-uridine 2-sulfurtransferase